MQVLKTLKETFLTSLPLIIIVLLVTVFLAPFDNAFDYIRLGVGYIGIVLGQSLFLIGLNRSILPIGELLGRNLIKLKRFIWIVLFGLLFGLLATVAEPALAVLARQTHLLINEINELLFIWIMGAGIGIFVAFSLWRIVKNISIKWVFCISYILLFTVIIFVPWEFVALAFDGSGATTGDISVPFVLALGLGVSATLSKRKDKDDTFGIIGIASIGPILTIFIYGIILERIHGGVPPVGIYDPGAAAENILEIIITNIVSVALAVFPMLLVFLPFQFMLLKIPKKNFIQILKGIVPVLLGLLIFLASIDFGFAFVGMYVGEIFLEATRPYWFRWILLPISFILGAAITLTEPAVTVLGEKLEEISNKKINRMTIRITLALGIGVAAMLAITKILTQVNILWYLLPLYATALIMMKFTPRLFVGLAFDSGGIAGGALTSALLTPLTLGIAQAIAQEAGPYAQSVLTNGFGIIAFISVTPLIAVQALGIYASRDIKSTKVIRAMSKDI